METAELPAPGETVMGRNFRRAPGGKGSNQAVAVARMGRPCALVGAAGADAFGDELVAGLLAAGVKVEAVARRSGTESGTALILVDSRGQNQIAVAAGANGTLGPADIKPHEELIRQSRAVIAQLESPLVAVEAALRMAREAGVLTALNPAPFVAGCGALLPLCDWVVPNEREAEHLTGIEVNSLERAREAAAILRRPFARLNVLVTLGANGAWLDGPSRALHVPGFRVEAIDAVGAGDTFIGAFVTRLVEGAEPGEAARSGCAAAALAVTRRGAQAAMPVRAEVEAFLKSARTA